jgi:hypothetical protein
MSKMKLFGWDYGCFYGKDYDLDKEQFPDPNKSYDVILFLNLKDENRRVVSSIEGVFFYNKPIENENKDSGNLEKKFVLKRSEMKEFEKKYDGEFVPCYCGKK